MALRTEHNCNWTSMKARCASHREFVRAGVGRAWPAQKSLARLVQFVWSQVKQYRRAPHPIVGDNDHCIMSGHVLSVGMAATLTHMSGQLDMRVLQAMLQIAISLPCQS